MTDRCTALTNYRMGELVVLIRCQRAANHSALNHNNKKARSWKQEETVGFIVERIDAQPRHQEVTE